MALTTTENFYVQLGASNVLVGYEITGDGSTTTWTVPVGTIDSAWLSLHGTTGGTLVNSLSWATNVLTFTPALAAASTCAVFVIGDA